jgi:hypothetical protein
MPPEGVPEGWEYDSNRKMWFNPEQRFEFITDEALAARRVAPKLRRPRNQLPGDNIRIVLEVSLFDDTGAPQARADEVARLVRELEAVKKQDGDVTLTVNGYGMDLWLRDARAERSTW